MTPVTAQQDPPVLRAPVVSITGHIDHGKTTLLARLRGHTETESEAGGITQHLFAHEVAVPNASGLGRITFLDTPGHEAFAGIRSRGVGAADIALLVVSAEDGVKPQTLESLSYIKDGGIPFIVVLTKTDKPTASVERTKQSLAEHGVYVEGYGGDVPVVAVSAKTGAGLTELVEMIELVASLKDLRCDLGKPAEGVVLEAHREKTRGIAATLVIKDGSMKSGMAVAAGGAFASIRIMESPSGAALPEAVCGSAVRIVGWSAFPAVGERFRAFGTKREAEEAAAEKSMEAASGKPAAKKEGGGTSVALLPIIVKADTAGSLEAVEREIGKLPAEEVRPTVLTRGIGDVTETDAKLAEGTPGSLVVAFNVGADRAARNIFERSGIRFEQFDVIYALLEKLRAEIAARRPRRVREETRGTARILKVFSRSRDRQIAGGRVASGEIAAGDEVKIIRRGAELGRGKIRELQQQKVPVSSVGNGKEFGALIVCPVEVAPGDELSSFTTVSE